MMGDCAGERLTFEVAFRYGSSRLVIGYGLGFCGGT